MKVWHISEGFAHPSRHPRRHAKIIIWQTSMELKLDIDYYEGIFKLLVPTEMREKGKRFKVYRIIAGMFGGAKV